MVKRREKHLDSRNCVLPVESVAGGLLEEDAVDPTLPGTAPVVAFVELNADGADMTCV